MNPKKDIPTGKPSSMTACFFCCRRVYWIQPKNQNPAAVQPCDNQAVTNRSSASAEDGATELIAILTYEFITQRGAYHLHTGKGNEDRVRIVQGRGVTAAVVCDGAGSSRFGANAAEAVSRLLSALLAEDFEMLYRSSAEDVRLRVIQAVEQCLHRHSQDLSAPAWELACTILAAAVAEDGRCLCFHLGDGIILQKNGSDGPASVVSSPMTGLAPHSTYLTMNCDMSQYLRFYRWQASDLSQLLLLSDGAAEHLVRPHDTNGWVYNGDDAQSLRTIAARLTRKHPQDDFSIARLIRTVA